MLENQMMQGKTIFITGATDGIGEEIARQLANHGAHLLIHGRNPQKTGGIREKIISMTGNHHVEIVIADFQAMDNLRMLAKEVLKKTAQLDVLINNAGTFQDSYVETPDGFEMTFAVNHLAPFLLTHLLLDLMKASAPSRIVTVASSVHSSVQADLENLNAEKKFHGWRAYCLSKLGNLLFTFALARRLEGTRVTANALHPGAINTKLLNQALGMTGEAVEQGAETPVYLACSPEVEGVSGEYFIRKQRAMPSKDARNVDLQEKFWGISSKMVGIDA